MKHLTLVVTIAAAFFVFCGSTELPQGEEDGDLSNSNENRAPVINPIQDQTLPEGQDLELEVAVNDPDNDTLFLEVFNLPDDAVFDPIQGTLTYAPDYDLVSAEEGSLTLPDIQITVDDDELSDSTTFSITVMNVNRTPFFLSDDAAPLAELEVHLDPDTEERIRFQVIDPDDDSITVLLAGSPAYARLEEQTLILSPSTADSGAIDQFDINATDGADNISLPVRVVVGLVPTQLPSPSGLTQTGAEGDIAAGGSVYEGEVTLSASPHTFDQGALHFQVEITEVGETYDDGQSEITDPISAGATTEVVVSLTGGKSYRWRARYISDDFGAGPYLAFGGNGEGDADVIATIVADTVIDEPPHDPSGAMVIIEYSSSNVGQFECQLDTEDYEECNAYRTSCDGSDGGSVAACDGEDHCVCARKTLFGLSIGSHTFRIRAVSDDDMPDPTPAEVTWNVVSATPPTISLDSYDISGCDADFEFSTNTPSNTFECRLYASSPGIFRDCDSPAEYTPLCTGSYTFEVHAVNVIGETSTDDSHTFSTTCSCE